MPQNGSSFGDELVTIFLRSAGPGSARKLSVALAQDSSSFSLILLFLDITEKSGS